MIFDLAIDLKVKFKVIKTVSIWMAKDNNIGVELEIISLSDFVPELQSQMSENAWILT